jgi:phosphatidylserine/phosphatidylglycerophosphate/cardiolipin synthase-like enzyme
MVQCAAKVIELFTNATTSIYYSSFVCQMNVALPGFPHVTMKQLTSQAVERGVAVRMFFNPSTQYGNETMSQLDTDPRVQLRAVSGDGDIPAPFNYIFGDSYSNHHQKFLIVDGQHVMVGGVGVHPCRSGWLMLNTESPPYYWHEVGVVTACNPNVSIWVEKLWNNHFTPPPLPLMAAATEHLTTLELIKTAKACIHLEAQLCISTDTTSNQILTTVVDRLHRAYTTKGDRFCFIMLVNSHQPDEHVVVSAAASTTLQWSRRMMLERAVKLGVSPLFLEERVFIGTMEYNATHIKVHSNLIIQDGHTMIRTSSNITDRSLSENPCDNELGVVVHGNAVASAQQELWKRYLMVHPTSNHLMPHDVVKHMRNETGVVRKVEYHKGFDATIVPDSVVNFIMKSVHKLPYFGGSKHISWNSNQVSRSHPHPSHDLQT